MKTIIYYTLFSVRPVSVTIITLSDTDTASVALFVVPFTAKRSASVALWSDTSATASVEDTTALLALAVHFTAARSARC
jgi:hypothetical protein